MRKRVLILLLLTFALSPRRASADPLRITSGVFALEIEGDMSTFSGAGFSLTTTETLIYAAKQFTSQCVSSAPKASSSTGAFRREAVSNSW